MSAAITSGHIDKMLAVNVKGFILVAREVLSHLPEGGRIINIASELRISGGKVLQSIVPPRPLCLA